MRPEKRSLPLEEPPRAAPTLMHPLLWDLRRRLLGWRVRMLVELAVLGAVLYGLHRGGAPGWASLLVVYVATRASRLDTAADAGALQETIRIENEPVYLDGLTKDGFDLTNVPPTGQPSKKERR